MHSHLTHGKHEGNRTPQARQRRILSRALDAGRKTNRYLYRECLLPTPLEAILRILAAKDVKILLATPTGQILPDIIASGAIPVARLTEVFRQAAESRVVVHAHRINRGDMPEWPKRGEASDFWFVDVKDPEEGAAKVVEIVRDRIPRRFGFDPICDIQVPLPDAARRGQPA